MRGRRSKRAVKKRERESKDDRGNGGKIGRETALGHTIFKVTVATQAQEILVE